MFGSGGENIADVNIDRQQNTTEAMPIIQSFDFIELTENHRDG